MTAFTVTPVDEGGLTDGSPVYGLDGVVTDALAFTDLILFEFGVLPLDAQGLTDAASKDVDKPTVDDLGMTDALATQVDSVKSDALGLTDDANVALDGAPTTPEDSLGLTDGSPVLVSEGTAVNALGLTDAVVATVQTSTVLSVLIEDALTLMEPGQTSTTYDVEEDETVIASDSSVPVAPVFVTDSLALVDSLVIDVRFDGGDYTADQDEALGFTDFVSFNLSSPTFVDTGEDDDLTLTDTVGINLLTKQVMLRLVLNLGVFDAPRPDDWFWRRCWFQPSQAALLVYPDGRVIVVDSLLTDEARNAPFIAGGGHETILEPDSWQAQVLIAAGYEMEPVI